MSRQVLLRDAIPWLRELPEDDARLPGAVVTSLPDASEFSIDSLVEYEEWFREAVSAILDAVELDTYPVVFYQTDRRTGGRILSKARMILSVAEGAFGVGDPIWHKIVLRRDPGSTTIYRPGYSHMICLGGTHVSAGKPVPDVIERSRRVYEDAMSWEATRTAVSFVARHADHVTDPFCGVGTVLAAGEAYGLDALGVDIDVDMVERARNLEAPEHIHERAEEETDE